jgi:hypothetical protein
MIRKMGLGVVGTTLELPTLDFELVGGCKKFGIEIFLAFLYLPENSLYLIEVERIPGLKLTGS